MASVTEKEVLTLAKLLGLLGSDQMGERAAAALKAAQWVKQRGVSWKEVLLPEGPPVVQVQVKGAPSTEDMLRAEITGWRQRVAALQHELDTARGTIRSLEAKAASQAASSQASGGPYGPRYGSGGWTAAQAQAASGAAQAAAAGGPAWLGLAQDFMTHHAGLLRGSKEQGFLQSQIDRGVQYGDRVRVSDAQEKWLRDILSRAGMSW